ncbi:MAG: prepilin-type N-terminal cleavage/methylation domain-containing protein [Verrucomicrobiota bacterium]
MKKDHAFSLIEIIAAIAIGTFVIAAILGLFPLALQTARDSHVETRIAMVAESILADLFISTDEKIKIPVFKKNGELISHVFMPTEDASGVVLSVDAEGFVLGITDCDYLKGDPDAVYLAKISMKTKEDNPGIGEVLLCIETPGAAASARRKKYCFVTLKKLPNIAFYSPEAYR